MTPRRVEEFKVESEKLKVMERLSRDLHNFTLYVLHFTLASRLAGYWYYSKICGEIAAKSVNCDFVRLWCGRNRDGFAARERRGVSAQCEAT